MSRSRRRRPFRWTRVAVALTIVAGVNAGAYVLWQEKFPELTLVPVAANTPQVPSVDVKVAQTAALASPVRAQTLTRRLTGVFPYLGAGWRATSPGDVPLGLAVDAVCPVSGPVVPAVQSQRSWLWDPSVSSSASDVNSRGGVTGEVPSVSETMLWGFPAPAEEFFGVSVQARAYPAGLGPVAMKQVRSQVQSCTGEAGWSVTGMTDLPVGAEGFGFTVAGDSATVNVSMFRSGDLVGVVVVRGGVDASALATQWQMSWPKVIGTFCADRGSTIEDADRQPLSGAYTGLKKYKPLRLAEDRKATIQAEVRAEVQQVAPADAALLPSLAGPSTPAVAALPDRPSATAGAELQVGSVSGLAGVPGVPDAPSAPVYPVFPAEPDGIGQMSGPIADTVGPGCGWLLTGQGVPPVDEVAAPAVWVASQARETERLADEYTVWVRATWAYASRYRAYVEQVAVWNAWVVTAQETVDAAAWRAYDGQVAALPGRTARFEADLARWEECVSFAPDPSPTVDPAASPSPTPVADPAASPTGDPSASPSPTVSPTVGPTVDPSASSAPLMQATQGLMLAKAGGCGQMPVEPADPVRPDRPRPLSVPEPVSPPVSDLAVLPSVPEADSAVPAPVDPAAPAVP